MSKYEICCNYINMLEIICILVICGSPHTTRAAERSSCPKCSRSRRFYCYNCYCYVGTDEKLMPRVRLPIPVDIVKHPLEVPGKSTAVHGKMLSPSVSLYEFPEFPNYTKEEGVYLMYPSKEAQSAQALISPSSDVGEGKEHILAVRLRVKKLVLIDSTWQKAKEILRDDRVSTLPCVRLSGTETKFWRPQPKNVDSTCLATIEALYYFFKTVYELVHDGHYSGCYDDLLYFFVHHYKLVHSGDRLRHRFSN
jgi:DTW domain-containing protein YfiP